MFWRPVAALLSLVLGLGMMALVMGYIHLAHDLGRPIQIVIGAVVYVGSSYAAMVWLLGSESLKLALHRTRGAEQVLGVAGLAWASIGGLGCLESRERLCPDCQLLSVTRIIDGETLVTGIGRVRLYGIDAPEVGERCSRDATEELRRLAGIGYGSRTVRGSTMSSTGGSHTSTGRTVRA